MAKLGVRTVEELVGRTDLIKVREKTVTKRAAMADLSQILYIDNSAPQDDKHFKADNVFNFELEKTVDEAVIIPAFKTALKTGKPKAIDIEVSSTNRTLGTIFGSEITKKYKNTLPDDTYTINCKGGGGQSFGAFIPKGLTIRLSGDSNDYFGKGLSGDVYKRQMHGRYHPKAACKNAEEDFNLTDIERDIIKKHMFPLTLTPPKYRESVLVCLVDKVCSVYEIFKKNAYGGGTVNKVFKKIGDAYK